MHRVYPGSIAFMRVAGDLQGRRFTRRRSAVHVPFNHVAVGRVRMASMKQNNTAGRALADFNGCSFVQDTKPN